MLPSHWTEELGLIHEFSLPLLKTGDAPRMTHMWPFRYFGIHTDMDDVLDIDDRIYPRARSRIGPRYQVDTLPEPQREALTPTPTPTPSSSDLSNVRSTLPDVAMDVRSPTDSPSSQRTNDTPLPTSPLLHDPDDKKKKLNEKAGTAKARSKRADKRGRPRHRKQTGTYKVQIAEHYGSRCATCSFFAENGSPGAKPRTHVVESQDRVPRGTPTTIEVLFRPNRLSKDSSKPFSK